MPGRGAIAMLALAGLLECNGDETLSAYGAADVTWVLHELDGAPVAARATLVFPEAGRIAGNAPCNRFSARQEAPYPWFEAADIAATRRACPDLATEGRFLAALAEVTLAEVAGDTLILSNDAGREMVFRAER